MTTEIVRDCGPASLEGLGLVDRLALALFPALAGNGEPSRPCIEVDHEAEAGQ